MTRLNNQLHGKKVENTVQSLFGFPNQYINDLYDVPAEFDNEWGLQISVKTTCRDRIDLASAPRFFRNEKPIHLVVAHYMTVNGVKFVYKVTTYLLSKTALRTLKGKVPAEAIEVFDEYLKLFEQGEHDTAREFAGSAKASLLEEYGEAAIMLNPKVDQKTQRRVQCSIRLSDLEPYKVSETTTNYKGLRLPHHIV